jgi:hypothetical protein
MIQNKDIYIPIDNDESYNQTGYKSSIDNTVFASALLGSLLFFSLCNCYYKIKPIIVQFINNKRDKSTLESYILDRETTEIDNLDQECSICIDTFISEEVIIKLDCNHVYHKACIQEWFKNELICPNCRTQLEL